MWDLIVSVHDHCLSFCFHSFIGEKGADKQVVHLISDVQFIAEMAFSFTLFNILQS